MLTVSRQPNGLWCTFATENCNIQHANLTCAELLVVLIADLVSRRIEDNAIWGPRDIEAAKRYMQEITDEALGTYEKAAKTGGMPFERIIIANFRLHEGGLRVRGHWLDLFRSMGCSAPQMAKVFDRTIDLESGRIDATRN